MSFIIKVENISKEFIIGHEVAERYSTLRDEISKKARKVFSFDSIGSRKGGQPKNEVFLALKDISFDIEQGDRIGIIGRNGAGKSTLLKILSRITEPTSGRITIRGRVASLLEVGTGFHPELSGRENIFLNGAILGMSRSEIRRKFDEIVAFAEIEKFLDTPVKRYSSGMYVRLAFAVAAHLEPEILVVDEVLAVGDAQFQRKCLGKMEEISKGNGRTILFVSHNITAIKNLCVKCLLLEKGINKGFGDVDSVTNKYIHDGVVTNNRFRPNGTGSHNENIELMEFEVSPRKGIDITVESGISIDILFKNKKQGINLDATIFVYALDDTCLFEAGCIISSNSDSKKGVYRVNACVPPFTLNAGTYKINLIFGENQAYVLWRMNDIVSFDVENTLSDRGLNLNVPPGYLRPQIKWDYSFLQNSLIEDK
jgi:lipopolysaccharide transport system ATP-binding protein